MNYYYIFTTYYTTVHEPGSKIDPKDHNAIAFWKDNRYVSVLLKMSAFPRIAIFWNSALESMSSKHYRTYLHTLPVASMIYW
jgi:hypothetical protein